MGVVAALAGLLGTQGVACAAGPTDADKGCEILSNDDKACLDCHADKGFNKKLANGEKLSLTIDGAAFGDSVHGSMGCVSCHAQAPSSTHPDDVKNFESRRQYARLRNESCRACHGRVTRLYEGSAHGIQLRKGNAAAPVCGDCHLPHQVMPASVEQGSANACMACHGDAVTLHAQWLPNAGSHLRAVTCSACHAPDALRRVDLQVQVGSAPLTDSDGALQFEHRARSADLNHDGLDASEFRALLASFERDGVPVSLRGHIELQSGIAAHELPTRGSAIKDCVKCHDEKALPFQSVSVSSLDADGHAVRYDAHKDVLSSPLTWEALRGFYAIGGTRMKALDILLALGLAAGIAVPVLHLVVRRLWRHPPKTDGSTQ